MKLAVGLAAIGFGLATFFIALVWREFHAMGDVHLVVTNASPTKLIAASIANDPFGRQTLIRVGPLTQGQSATGDWHMPTSIGTVWLRVVTARGSMTQDAGVLLDDDGPYEFRVTVYNDRIDVERDNNEPETGHWSLPPATQP